MYIISLVPFLLGSWRLLVRQMMAEMKDSDPDAADADAKEGAAEGESDTDSDAAPPPLEDAPPE